MRLPFVTGLVPLLLCICASAYSAEPILIKIPCDKDPFPKCADLKTLLINGSLNGKQAGLKSAVADLLKDIYEGKVKVPVDAAPGSNSCSTLNLVGKPEICPPLKVPENDCKDEFRVNRNDKSCGELAKVGPKGGGQYYFTLGRSTSGSLETAHISGGLVLAVSDSAIELAKEVSANGLLVEPTSPCYAQAQALRDLIVAQTDVKLLELVKGCDVTHTETCSTKKYFEATFDTIVAGYLLLARCRMTNEATSKFRSFAFDYQNRIENVVVKDCFNNFGTSSTAMKACYQKNYTSWIRARAKESFPNVAAICGN